jgi:hypothetical protein
VNSCFSIHREKPTAKIAVPTEAISAMKDIITLLFKVEHINKNYRGNASTNNVADKCFVNRKTSPACLDAGSYG